MAPDARESASRKSEFASHSAEQPDLRRMRQCLCFTFYQPRSIKWSQAEAPKERFLTFVRNDEYDRYGTDSHGPPRFQRCRAIETAWRGQIQERARRAVPLRRRRSGKTGRAPTAVGAWPRVLSPTAVPDCCPGHGRGGAEAWRADRIGTGAASGNALRTRCRAPDKVPDRVHDRAGTRAELIPRDGTKSRQGHGKGKMPD